MQDAVAAKTYGYTPPLSLRKLTTMMLLTGGLYSLVWYRRCLKAVEEHAPSGRAITPRVLRFALFHVGVIGLVFFFREVVYPFGPKAAYQFLLQRPWLAGIEVATLIVIVAGALEPRRFFLHDFEEFRHESGGILIYQHPEAYIYTFCSLFALWMLPNPFRVVALLGAFTLRPLQLAMNNYLDGLNVRSEEETQFSPGDLLFAVAVGVVMLWVVGGAIIYLVDRLNPTTVPGI